MMRFCGVVVVMACSTGAATPPGQSGSADPQRSSPAAAGSQRPSPGSADSLGSADPSAMDAPHMFAALCAHCHGAEAQGYKADQAPSLVSSTFLESASNDYLKASIERGRPGTSMAAYAKSVGGPLTPEAVDRLVAWLRARGGPARELAPVPAGSASRGEKLYTAQCFKCHGDRQTRGEYLMLANPRFLEAASDGFLQHAIIYGRPATPMQAFQSKLSAQEVADIVAYVRSFAQPVESRQLPAPTGTEPLFVDPKGQPPRLTVKDGRFVAAADVKAALDAKRKMVVIDARPESEWMTVHIVGAVSIPHYQLKRLAEIPKDAWIVAYCACPHHLSGLVVDELQKRGYAHATVLDEGILEWQRRGYPVVAAPGAPTPPKPRE